jgi:adenosylhomocysteine nucleosidase
MIIAATGLRSEAAIIARAGVTVLSCGGNGAVLAARLEAAIAAQRPAGLISIGICGGLEPLLPVGALVIGTAVNGMATDRDWAARLATALPHARVASVAGVDTAAFDSTAKAALFAATGAAIIDMESQVVARIAATHGLPFAILRAVSDAAADSLPHAARVPLRPDGSVQMGQVLAAVAARPWQIPALIRLAGNADKALKALAAAVDAMCEGLAGSA